MITYFGDSLNWIEKSNLVLGRPTRRLLQQPRCKMKVAGVSVIVTEMTVGEI